MKVTNRVTLSFPAHQRLALTLLLALLAALFTPLISPAHAATDLVMYDDALATPFSNWSYGATVDFANTAPVVGSSGNSVAVAITGGYGALQFGAATPIDLSGYSAVSFKIYGANGGSQLQSYIVPTSGAPAGPNKQYDAPAGVWTTITIPLSQLGNPATLQVLAIQDRTGAAQPTFYVDDVRLVAGSNPPPPPPSTTDLGIYGDALASGWANWSYGATVDFANTAPVVGTTGASIAVTITGAYGALQFGAPGPIDLAPYTAVRFKVYGAAGGNQLQSYIVPTNGGQATPGQAFDAPAGVWTEVTIPLAQYGNPTTLQVLAIQDRTGAAQSTFYVDDVRLVGSGTPPPPPVHPYRKLRDVDIFTGKPNGSYVYAGGGTTIESDNTFIPLDTTQVYSGTASYRIHTTGTSGYWGAGIARGWLTYTLRNYRQYGDLEFNVKGAKGGETFEVALYDRQYERPTEGGAVSISVSAPVSRYATVSTGWTQVKIPLRDLVPDGSNFYLDGVQVVQVRGAGEQTFWLDNIRFTANVDEPGYPAIKVNQLGYTPKAEKYALVSGFAEDLAADVGTAFHVKNATGQSVYDGVLSLVSANDASISGEKVLKADFSTLETPGTYTIVVDAPKIDASLPFAIGADLYTNLLRDASRYFYYQRSGIALLPQYAGIWTHGVGHPQDKQAVLRSSTLGPNPITRTLDVSGGWYDAGDYGRYVTFAGNAVGDLLWAYELFPNQFKDNQNNIPESGNGVPDILDEVRWELNWIMKMQDRSSGGFYHMIYPNNGIESDTYTPNNRAMPDTHDVTRYVEDCEFQSYDQVHPERSVVGPACNIKPTADTASAVAMLAQAATNFRKVDPAYSFRLTIAALYGWYYLEKHPEQINIAGQNGGVDDDRDNRLWAAAELFRLTGAERFNRYFLAHYQAPQFAKWWTSTTDSAFVDDGTLSMRADMAYLRAPSRNPAAVRWISQNFQTWRQTMLTRQQGLAWRNYLLGQSPGIDTDYFWGSNSVTLQISTLLVTGSKFTNTYDNAIIGATRANVNYILGINPLRKSYVTGYGADSARVVYSFIYSWDGKDTTPPGIMVGGPNTYENGIFSRFVGKTWVNNNSNWAADEEAIYWNSPLVFASAALADAAGR